MSESACPVRAPSAERVLPSGLPDPHLASNWFAVFTTPRHEKRVEQHLRLRNVESFLPLYRSPRKWRNGLKVVLELPLFPGYIFVRIRRSERVKVLEVPGVVAIVGGAAGQMARRERLLEGRMIHWQRKPQEQLRRTASEGLFSPQERWPSG